MLALDGAEGDCAVVYVLGNGGVAAAGDGECVVAVDHGERTGSIGSTLSYHHCHYGQQQYGKDS